MIVVSVWLEGYTANIFEVRFCEQRKISFIRPAVDYDVWSKFDQ